MVGYSRKKTENSIKSFLYHIISIEFYTKRYISIGQFCDLNLCFRIYNDMFVQIMYANSTLL